MDCAPRAACLFGEAYSLTTVDCALPVDCVDVGAWSIEVVIFEAIASRLLSVYESMRQMAYTAFVYGYPNR